MRKATGTYRRQAASTNNACQPSGKTKRTNPSPPQSQQLQAKMLRKMEKAGSSGTRRKGPLAGARGSAAGTAGVSRPYGRAHGGSGEQTTIGGGGGGERDHRSGIPRRGFPK